MFFALVLESVKMYTPRNFSPLYN